MSNELNKMQNSKQLQIIEKIRNKIEKNNSWFMIDGNLDMVFKKALDNLPALEKLTENNLKIQLEYYYQEEFNKIIKDKLLNDNNFVFMQLFLEHSIKKMNHHQESKKFLSSLLTVFANIDYSLTYADCLFIVKNGFVDNAMRNILLDENGNIKRDVISKNLNNNLFTLICPFCEIHSIDIETELEINLEKDGDSKETNISYVLTDHALGDYIKQIPNIKLSKEDVICLTKRKDLGDEAAFEKLVLANLPLVVSIACKYKDYSIPVIDLIQEGNIGLMNSIRHYDYRLGAVSTYATWFITQSINRAIANYSRAIRIPIWKQITYSKYRRLQHELEQRLGREASVAELANEFNTDAANVNDYLINMRRIRSLNELIKDNDAEIIELIPDESLEMNIQKDDFHGIFEPLLKYLKIKDRFILVHRFGLNGVPKKTLGELSQIFGLSKEGVRLSEKEAINNLMELPMSESLTIYLERPDEGKRYLQHRYLGKKYQRNIFQTLCINDQMLSQILVYLDKEELCHLQLMFGNDLLQIRKPTTDEDLSDYILKKLVAFKLGVHDFDKIQSVSVSLKELIDVNDFELSILFAILRDNDQQLLLKKYCNNIFGETVISLCPVLEKYFTNVIVKELRLGKYHLINRLREENAKERLVFIGNDVEPMYIKAALTMLNNEELQSLESYVNQLLQFGQLRRLIMSEEVTESVYKVLIKLNRYAENYRDTGDFERSMIAEIPLSQVLRSNLVPWEELGMNGMPAHNKQLK